MTRTGTVALSRIALLAALACWPVAAWAQSSAATSSDEFAATWKPTRSDSKPASAAARNQSPAKAAAKPAAKKWIAPNQSSRPTTSTATATKASNTSQLTGPRAPRPFSPPVDAQQLSAAPRTTANQSSATTSSSAATVRSTARKPQNQPPADRSGPRTQEARVSYRPRPTSPARSSVANRVMEDTWLGSLRQVAYQAGEPEELYAPPGHESAAPMPGGSMREPMGDPMMGPTIEPNGEWIGSPGGACCDGSCGPDCDCGPGCGDGVGCCSTCNKYDEPLDLCTVGPHDDEACHTIRLRLPKFQEFMVFGGVHGFKGPYDRNRDSGNFGFQEGFNVGAKLPFLEAGYQVGYQAQQSQLNGDESTGIADAFSQHFFTTGVFKRNRDGFQGGAVWDLLMDERDSSVAFSQIRAEFGFVDCGCHEFGVTGSVHLNDNLIIDPTQETITTFQAVDQYLLYYRMHGPRGGEGRVYGGLTDDVDGIIGADFHLPLTENFALLPAFTYMIPDSNHSGPAASEEAWNISIALVWHWRGHARSCHSSPYRPLFNVADNGYLIIDNRP